MNTLRFAIVWHLIGWALVSFVVYMSLSAKPPDLIPAFDLGDKFMHAFAYFTLMSWFGQLYQRRWHFAWMLGFSGLGLLMEFLQGQINARVFDWVDALANLSGAVLAWLLLATVLAHCLQWFERQLPTGQ